MINAILAIILLGLIFLLFQRKKQQKLKASKHLKQGEEFLQQNKQKEGVETSRSGLQYQFLTQNEDTRRPVRTDKVSVHYHGTLLDGTVFDSSVERGEKITFGLTQVIPGWTEGLQLMSPGEKIRLFIPQQLAYGTSGAGALIPPGATLIFDVELFEINPN